MGIISGFDHVFSQYEREYGDIEESRLSKTHIQISVWLSCIHYMLHRQNQYISKQATANITDVIFIVVNGESHFQFFGSKECTNYLLITPNHKFMTLLHRKLDHPILIFRQSSSVRRCLPEVGRSLSLSLSSDDDCLSLYWKNFTCRELLGSRSSIWACGRSCQNCYRILRRIPQKTHLQRGIWCSQECTFVCCVYICM